jgi:hypothetical protein
MQTPTLFRPFCKSLSHAEKRRPQRYCTNVSLEAVFPGQAQLAVNGGKLTSVTWAVRREARPWGQVYYNKVQSEARPWPVSDRTKI